LSVFILCVLQISLEKSGYTPGECITMTSFMRNNSQSSISMKVDVASGHSDLRSVKFQVPSCKSVMISFYAIKVTYMLEVTVVTRRFFGDSLTVSFPILIGWPRSVIAEFNTSATAEIPTSHFANPL
ncbi:hypothetical protein PFISCL1PPCAC_8933, partial [Pristionchus fissidentatus]